MWTARRAAALLVFAFVALVGFGTTGSSLDIGLTQQSELVSSDQKVLLGINRPIRSDEWVVFTPMAIAQFNHQPRFPVVNRNLGSDGQNMLVAGMAGVPVLHISQFAKPSTWGFYIFDLRRALAWYWWLPVFGSLFAVWGVMSILLPGRWAVGLATAAAFVTSAYVAAWSNWPAYVVMFPAAGFCFFVKIFRTTSWVRLLTLGMGLGLSLAGFVFVLYPPWQVSVGYLFLFLLAGIILQERLWRQFSGPRAAVLALAALIAALLCWTWWVDARPAIDAIQNTVYPGRRVAAPGGGLSIWETFRGFINSHSLYYEHATLTNQSESSSLILLFPVATAAVALNLYRRQWATWPQISLIGFSLFVLWFQYIGLGATLAEWTLWGRVQPRRTDLAIGLASILLCGLTVAARRHTAHVRRCVALLISAISALGATVIVMKIPVGAIGLIEPSIALLAFPIVFMLSYWLLRKDATAFVLGMLFMTCSMSLPFNPLVRAPSHVSPVGDLLQQASAENERVLVVGTQIAGMELVAAGVPVTSGVFYYPQRSIWGALDPAGTSAEITNRYQHLLFDSDTTGTVADYIIEAPYPDVVRVIFNPQSFDFGLTGADFVLASSQLDLSENVHVDEVGILGSRTIYRVLTTTEAAKPN